MSFCRKCGTEIGKNAKFCPKCGTAQSERNNTTISSDKKAKLEKVLLSSSAIKIVVFAVILLAVILLLKSCASSKRGVVDVEKCVEYTVSGVDLGDGYLEAEIDMELLKSAVIKANKELKKSENSHDLESVLKYTHLYYDNNFDLSNGDKVSMNIDYDEKIWEKYELSPKKEAWIYKVQGLYEKKKIDVRQCFSVTIAGDDSSGQAKEIVDKDKLKAILIKANPDLGKVEHESDLDSILSVGMQLDKSTNLSNGEKVVVTLSPRSVTEEYGLEFSPLEWTVEVTTLDEDIEE